MGSNAFGTIFKMTTWGESHGKAIGVVIDGCPAGISLDEKTIDAELVWRAPGVKSLTSPRKEGDKVEILSGVFEGKTTGSPISLVIWNRDAESKHYDSVRDKLKPGHANYTYMQKYGIFDHRGGGRASGRETACRVAAGAVAKKLLSDVGVFVVAYIKSIGSIESNFTLSDLEMSPVDFQSKVKESALFCPDPQATLTMEKLLTEVIEEKDSLGGVIEAVAFGVPVGWGDPVYEKLEGNLAKAMLTIPASKGFEIGEGFGAAKIKGSAHNDLFKMSDDQITLATNNSGGVLGGISNGMPIVIRIPFKPTSSIGKQQATVSFQGKNEVFALPEGSRHDPCVAIRAVPVVEAMFALVLADAMLLDRCAR